MEISHQEIQIIRSLNWSFRTNFSSDRGMGVTKTRSSRPYSRLLNVTINNLNNFKGTKDYSLPDSTMTRLSLLNH